MDALKFVMELVDRMSGPGKAIQRSLKGVDDTLKKLDLGKVGAGLGKVGAGFVNISGKAAKAGGAFLKDFAPYAIAAITAVETAFVGLGVTAGTYALKQIAEQEDNDLALRTVLKDTKDLDAAMSAINGIASIFRTSPDEIEKEMTRLIQKGHSLNDSIKIVQGAHDLKVLGADVGAVIDAFTALDDKGKVTSKTIAALAGVGLNPQKLRAILGSAIGSTGDLTADIEAGIKAGTIDSVTLQAAALKTITEMSGKELGGLAAEQSKTLGGIINAFKTLPDRLFNAIDSSAMGAPIEAALEDALAVFEGPAGKAAVTAMSGAFVEMSNVMRSVLTPENITMFVAVMGRLGSIVFSISKAFAGPFFTALVGALKPLKDVMMLSDGNSYAIKGFMKGVQVLGYVIGGVVAAIVYGFLAIGYVVGFVVGAVTDFVTAIPGWVKGYGAAWMSGIDSIATWTKNTWDSIIAWFASLPDKFAELGSNIIQGLRDGILGGADIKGTMHGVTDDLVKAAQTSLKIHSPSRVFMDLGMNTTEGFNLGLQQGGASTPSIFADLVRPPQLAAGGMGGGSSVSNTVGDVHVYVENQGGNDPNETGRGVGRGARRELIRLFDDLVPA